VIGQTVRTIPIESLKTVASILSPAGKRGRLMVFCFHQVLASKDELRPDEPCLDQFVRDIDFITNTFSVLSLPDAMAGLAAGDLPSRAASITFDDGYANNHELAAPVMESAGVTATIFVAGGAVDTGIMWNDLIIEAIRHDRGAFNSIGREQHDGAAESVMTSQDEVSRVLGALKYTPMKDRWEIAERGYEEARGGALPRLMMTREMVKDLAERGFDIGGHTINHPILCRLADEQAREEIESCSAWIESVTGQTPTMFAYPNGKSGIDFDSRHCKMVRDAGFTAAFSTDWKLETMKSDPFSIGRIGPWWQDGKGVTNGLLRLYLKSYL